MNSKKKQRLRYEVAAFMKEYGRKKGQGSNDPNDRHYDRKLEKKLKKMKPEELDDLLNG